MSESRLYRGDNLAALSDIEAGGVQLVVTSPPYNVGYDYRDGGAGDSLPLPEYLHMLGRTLAHLQIVLKTGGVLALNVPQTIRTAHHRAYPLASVIAAQLLLPMGWLLREPIVWVKATDGVTPTASTTAFGAPTNPYARPVHEMVLLASKETYSVAGMSNEWGVADYLEATKDVWVLPPGRRSGAGQPLAFPEALVARLIGLFSSPGDVVLDPWAGTGTTGKVARAYGREAWLIEREPGYWPMLEAVVLQAALPGVA